ncbi:hypothetical protein EDB85DRAFT_2270442 [Lactarius pseudohatsudake]|nr:hypothetical protein EDB85DRAFT_2270442 [Lactarius pseudohatsudake]
MGPRAPFRVTPAPRLFCAPLHPFHAGGRRYPSALRRGGTRTHVAPARKAEGHRGLAPVACPCGAPTGEEGGASVRLPVRASAFVAQTREEGGYRLWCTPSSLTRSLPFARWPLRENGGAPAQPLVCVSPLRVNQGRGAAALLLVSRAWPSARASSSERGRGRGKGGRGPPSHSRGVARSRGTPPVLATPSNIPPHRLCARYPRSRRKEGGASWGGGIHEAGAAQQWGGGVPTVCAPSPLCAPPALLVKGERGAERCVPPHAANKARGKGGGKGPQKGEGAVEVAEVGAQGRGQAGGARGGARGGRGRGHKRWGARGRGAGEAREDARVRFNNRTRYLALFDFVKHKTFKKSEYESEWRKNGQTGPDREISAKSQRLVTMFIMFTVRNFSKSKIAEIAAHKCISPELQ